MQPAMSATCVMAWSRPADHVLGEVMKLFFVPLIPALLILSSVVAPYMIYTIILHKSVAVSKLQFAILA